MMEVIYFSYTLFSWVVLRGVHYACACKLIVLIIVKKRGILLSVDVGGGFLPKVDFRL